MPRQVTIVTPENVEIDYELAGIASRIGAVILDTLLQALMMLAVGVAFFSVVAALSISVTTWVTAVVIVAEFVIYWGYYIYFETAWNGQTPGKRSLRLRTVRAGGMPIDLGCASTRNLIRVVDSLLIGLVSMLATSKNQRLGDLAAGTLVVKERAEWTERLEPDRRSPIVRHAEAACVKNIELITPREFEAARRFVERQAELEDDVREQLAAKIARPLMARLGIEDDGNARYSGVLAEIHRRCVEERGMR